MTDIIIISVGVYVAWVLRVITIAAVMEVKQRMTKRNKGK